MSDPPARDTVQQREAVVAEITQALGDEASRTSPAWWQYFFVVTDLGADPARALVREVWTVEAQGGMTTNDGSRRRTPGGIFFALAKDRLGPKQMRKVRGRADRRFQEEMVRRFVRLLALVPCASARDEADGAGQARPVEPPAPTPTPTPTAPAAGDPRGARPVKRARASAVRPAPDPAAAPQGPPSRPAARRPEPVVEVVVVRRRRP